MHLWQNVANDPQTLIKQSLPNKAYSVLLSL